LRREDFPCYDLALTAAELGDNYACALNGAGEIAVRAFLDGRISFPAIAETVKDSLFKTERIKNADFAALKETDQRARALACEYITAKLS
jgi:1-deoxy-D-xylulose-5-phosphate reductoisomerase